MAGKHNDNGHKTLYELARRGSAPLSKLYDYLKRSGLKKNEFEITLYDARDYLEENANSKTPLHIPNFGIAQYNTICIEFNKEGIKLPEAEKNDASGMRLKKS